MPSGFDARRFEKRTNRAIRRGTLRVCVSFGVRRLDAAFAGYSVSENGVKPPGESGVETAALQIGSVSKTTGFTLKMSYIFLR